MTWQLDATAQSALLDAREITPTRLLDQALARLDALEPVLNAFTHVDRDGASAAAKAATARQAAGARLGPLDGIPDSLCQHQEVDIVPVNNFEQLSLKC